MNKNILHKEVQDFIIEKALGKINIHQLLLSKSPFDTVSIQEIAQQIIGRNKTKHKLPTWYITPLIYYPQKVNLEQTSSEITALYKSNLISGNLLVDLTGGFGIDAYYFAKKMNKVILCELNTDLSQITTHNFNLLNVKNIYVKNKDGLKVILDHKFIDFIYIDPSRRNDVKGKVFFLEDCLPDVPNNLNVLFEKCSNILIKTSPLLDIQAGLNSLKDVKEIHVVAVQNEVKELLWVLEKDTLKPTKIITVNITRQQKETFSFDHKQELNVAINYSLPKKYLFEPNSAILKSGGFNSIGQKYNLEKLHVHSHLFTSNILIEFPGRIFEILKEYSYHKKNLKDLSITKANITIRNFPESVAVIRKKLKIREGGNDYLFFTTNRNNEKIMLVCKKKEELF